MVFFFYISRLSCGEFLAGGIWVFGFLRLGNIFD